MQQDLIETLWQERERMYRIAYSYMRNESDALEVVSETYAKAVAHHADLSEPKFAKTWLTRILINNALDALRKRKSHLTLEAAVDLAEPDASDLEMLLALPLEIRSIVFLRFVEQLQLKEISETLDIPLSTVKHRLYRGLELLRIEIKTEMEI